MNVNRFYREIFEQSLGLTVMGLDHLFPELIRLVEDKSLSTFSDYIPALYPIYLDLKDPTKLVPREFPARGREYYLDDPVLTRFGLDIIGLHSVKPQFLNASDPYDPEAAEINDAIIMAHSNLTIENLLMGAEYTYQRTLTSSSIPYHRYQELRGGRILYLENWETAEQVEVMVQTRWPNLVSVPEDYHKTLVDLATLDIKIYLWQDLKYVEDVTTPRGNLALRVNWEDAEERRNDFIHDLRSRSLPDRMMNHYYTII